MDASLAAVAAAGLGVLGTLLSPLLAQRSTDRTARMSAQIQRDAQLCERWEAAKHLLFEERRQTYTSLNALARSCRNTLKEVALQCETAASVDDEALHTARESWLVYQTEYDNSQMILHDGILPIASRVNSLLGQGYRHLREMAVQEPPSATAVVELCDSAVIESINLMRAEMRNGLGVSDDERS